MGTRDAGAPACKEFDGRQRNLLRGRAYIGAFMSAPPSMSRKVIGVDLGGTKLLAGVIDEQLEVHDRVHRVVTGMSEQAVIDAIVESVSELIKRNPDVEAVGFGIPCLIDQRNGHAIMCVNLPVADVPFRDVMAEKLGIPAFIDNDAN